MIKRFAVLTGSLMLLIFVVFIANIESVNAAVKIETVIAPIYDNVSPNGFDENGLAIVYKTILDADGSARSAPGIINKQGTVIVPIGLYNVISEFSEGLAAVDKGFVDLKGNLVVSFPHSGAAEFVNGLCVVSNESGWGVIDRAGNVIIPCEYRKIEGDFRTGYCVGTKISADNTRASYYILSKQGAVQVDADAIKSCTDTGAIVKRGSLAVSGIYGQDPNSTGYVDVAGNLKIPYIYDYLIKSDIHIRGDYLIAQKGDYEGVIDLNGNTVLDFKYQQVFSYANGFAYVKLNDKIGCVDTKGNIALPFKYDDVQISTINNDYVVLEGEDSTGWISSGYADLKGNIIIPIFYETPYESSQPLRVFTPVSEFILYYSSYNWGCINTKGKVVIPFEYQEINPFAGGLAAVVKNEKYGYVDKSGKVVIPTMYDNADLKGSVAGGLNYVKKGTKWGFVDVNNSPVTPFEYDESEDVPTGFKDGLAWVNKNNKYGLIKYTGTLPLIATAAPVPKFKASISKVKVGKQQKVLLSGTVKNDTFTYVCADIKIAQVDKFGSVTGKKTGVTTITVKSKTTGQVCSIKVDVVK